MSHSELAKILNTNHSIIGKYERDEVKPSIDVVKNLAEELDTTVGFLLGETTQTNILKNPSMLKRLNEIDALPEDDKHCILYTIDHLLASIKTQAAYK